MGKQFKVYHDDYMGSDDFKVIEAFDHEQAAEKYAEYYDSDGDYSVVGGSNILVKVEGPDGDARFLSVSGESVPSYNASDVSCKDCESTTKLRSVSRRNKTYGYWVTDTVCHDCFKNIKETA